MKESAENYLETILLLQKDKGTVRSIDVARALGYSKPSVSRAMGILREEGMLQVGDAGELILTKEGLKKAKGVLERHETITQFLMMTTDVSQEIAEQDACKMEHFINEKTFKGIKKFIKEVEEYNQ
ncbi:MAG: metal-dependent transcriptional regulator [Roseburia sp.]|nr:metal-dependent transcriptional regulator [Roseburia sp.]MCM1279301.1 metal-dependent transcriptional regulator [Robinsoniella sp.]